MNLNPQDNYGLSALNRACKLQLVSKFGVPDGTPKSYSN